MLEYKESDDLKIFLNAVNGEFDNSEYSVRIKSEINTIKNNRKWRKEYMTLEMFKKDAIREGLRLGREQGIKEGRQEGRE